MLISPRHVTLAFRSNSAAARSIFSSTEKEQRFPLLLSIPRRAGKELQWNTGGTADLTLLCLPLYHNQQYQEGSIYNINLISFSGWKTQRNVFLKKIWLRLGPLLFTNLHPSLLKRPTPASPSLFSKQVKDIKLWLTAYSVLPTEHFLGWVWQQL